MISKNFFSIFLYFIMIIIKMTMMMMIIRIICCCRVHQRLMRSPHWKTATSTTNILASKRRSSHYINISCRRCPLFSLVIGLFNMFECVLFFGLVFSPYFSFAIYDYYVNDNDYQPLLSPPMFMVIYLSLFGYFIHFLGIQFVCVCAFNHLTSLSIHSSTQPQELCPFSRTVQRQSS